MTPFSCSPRARFSLPIRLGLPLLVGVFVCLTACRQSPRSSSVQSYLQGRVVVDSAEHSGTGHSGFRVLVVRPDGRRLDTLGHTRTAPDGHFRMRIRAPKRGIYTLALWGRQGRQRVATTEYVVAAGDSASLHVELPHSRRSLRPESPENQALRAYRNAMAVHQRLLARRVRAEVPVPTAQAQSTRLISSTLWNISSRYPRTYAGQHAAVASLAHLEGWNDSLVVARARRIDSSSPRYVDVVRIARRAEARRHGQRAALDLLDTLQVRTSAPRQQAGVHAVRVQAFLDSTQFKAAFAAAERLREAHPGTRWAQWAQRVQYEAAHLQPGQPAPTLQIPSLQGAPTSLQALKGHPVVLEYYRPGSDLHSLQRPLRNALYDATRPDSVSFVSLSVEPDSLVNQAFLRTQRLPGRTTLLSQGLQDPMATRYNVVHTPTWILIDKDGRLVNRYRAGDFPSLRRHLIQLLSASPDASSRPPEPPHLFGRSFTEQKRDGLETSRAIGVLSLTPVPSPAPAP